MKKGEFLTIKVPVVLIDEINKLLKIKGVTYTTKASFITDAIRRHIEKVKKDIRDEKLLEEHKDYLETIEKAKH